MDHGVTTIEERVEGHPDHHPGNGGGDATEAIAERVVESAHHLSFLDVISEHDIDLGDAATAGPYPAARPAFRGTRPVWRRGLRGLDQPEVGVHPQNAVHAGSDGVLVESPCLTPFVEEHGRAGVGCGLA